MGGFLNDVLNSQVEKRRMELLGGPDYATKRRAAELSNLISEQEYEQSELEAPLKRSEITSKIESREALSKTRNAKLEFTKELEQAQQALIRAKMFPEEGSLQAREIEAQISGFQARSRMLDAQAGLFQARAANPEAFRAGASFIGPTVRVWDPQSSQEYIVDKRTGNRVGLAAPPASMRGTAQMGQMAKQMIGNPDQEDSIWALAAKINQTAGIAGRAIGLGRRGAAALGEDPDVQVYQDQLAGMASRLAKAFGESGRLSDQDIMRTVNMFPRIGDSPEVTDRKMQRVSSLIDALGDDIRRNSILVDTMWSAHLRGDDIATGAGGEDPGQPGQQGGGQEPIIQQSPSTGQFRHSFDGGATWQPGRP